MPTSTFLYDELTDIKGISLYGDCLVKVKTPTILAQTVNRASWLGPLRGIWRLRRVRRRLLRRPDSTRFEVARLTLECLVVGSSTAPGRADRRFLWPDPILEVMLRAVVRGADRLCSTLLEVYPRVYARMEGSLRAAAFRRVPLLACQQDADEICVFVLRNFSPYMSGTDLLVQTREMLDACRVWPVSPFTQSPYRLVRAPRWFNAFLRSVSSAAVSSNVTVGDPVSCRDDEMETILVLWDKDEGSPLHDLSQVLHAARTM